MQINVIYHINKLKDKSFKAVCFILSHQYTEHEVFHWVEQCEKMESTATLHLKYIAASRREDSSREGPVWQALSGHKRSNTLAVELPPQARGTGTLIPSMWRLVWAGKHQLGNAAWGASFPSERALPAGGFGSVHTPSP